MAFGEERSVAGVDSGKTLVIQLRVVFLCADSKCSFHSAGAVEGHVLQGMSSRATTADVAS